MLASDVELVSVAAASLRQIRFEGCGDADPPEGMGDALFRRASEALGGVDEFGGFRVVDGPADLIALAEEAEFALSAEEARWVESAIGAAITFWGEDEFEIRTGYTAANARLSIERLMASAQGGSDQG